MTMTPAKTTVGSSNKRFKNKPNRRFNKVAKVVAGMTIDGFRLRSGYIIVDPPASPIMGGPYDIDLVSDDDIGADMTAGGGSAAVGVTAAAGAAATARSTSAAADMTAGGGSAAVGVTAAAGAAVTARSPSAAARMTAGGGSAAADMTAGGGSEAVNVKDASAAAVTEGGASAAAGMMVRGGSAAAADMTAGGDSAAVGMTAGWGTAVTTRRSCSTDAVTPRGGGSTPGFSAMVLPPTGTAPSLSAPLYRLRWAAELSADGAAAASSRGAERTIPSAAAARFGGRACETTLDVVPLVVPPLVSLRAAGDKRRAKAIARRSTGGLLPEARPVHPGHGPGC